jgi:hypothetical protein
VQRLLVALRVRGYQLGRAPAQPPEGDPQCPLHAPCFCFFVFMDL